MNLFIGCGCGATLGRVKPVCPGKGIPGVGRLAPAPGALGGIKRLPGNGAGPRANCSGNGCTSTPGGGPGCPTGQPPTLGPGGGPGCPTGQPPTLGFCPGCPIN